jgi:hypothetical protein
MSTHWFHDHMFSFTAQNVYKGNAATPNATNPPKLYLVNLCEHRDGTKPNADLRLADALTPGKSNDPCVGSFLESSRREAAGLSRP